MTADVSQILSAIGLTGGGGFATLMILMSRGILVPRAQVNKLIDVMQAAVTSQLAIKDQNIQLLQDELAKSNLDGASWRTAYEAQRTRADSLSDKMIGEIVPLVSITNRLLESLGTVKGGEPHGGTVAQ